MVGFRHFNLPLVLIAIAIVAVLLLLSCATLSPRQAQQSRVQVFERDHRGEELKSSRVTELQGEGAE